MAWRAIRSIAFAAADDPAGLAGGAAKAEAAAAAAAAEWDMPGNLIPAAAA